MDFNIDDNKGEKPGVETLYIKNTLSKGNASFLKLDYKDHDIKLADAEFSLYQYNEGNRQLYPHIGTLKNQ